MKHQPRYLIIAIALIIGVAACSSEPRNFEEEVRHIYQNERGFFYLKIPPAILSLALKMADDQEMTDFFGDAKQVGIITFGEGFPVSKNPEIVNTLEEILARHDYEDLIRISDQDRLISMKIKENDGKATELVTIISETAGQVMALTLSGEINIQTVVKMVADFDHDMLMQMQGMGRR
jgi:hypothetical protein